MPAIIVPFNAGSCKDCIYHEEKYDTCSNAEYAKNIYKVACVWHRCRYFKAKERTAWTK